MMTYDRVMHSSPPGDWQTVRFGRNLISALRPDGTWPPVRRDRSCQCRSVHGRAGPPYALEWYGVPGNQCARKSWISRFERSSSDLYRVGYPLLGVVGEFSTYGGSGGYATIVYDGKRGI